MSALTIGQLLAEELKTEAAKTRSLIDAAAALPAEAWSWKPHEKSMPFSLLLGHVVELVGWIVPTIQVDDLDTAAMGDYKPFQPASADEARAALDKNTADAIAVLEAATDETMHGVFTLRKGEHVMFSMPRTVVMRATMFNHIYHHRGQLTVYLRLLNVPLPDIYGPTADSGKPMLEQIKG